VGTQLELQQPGRSRPAPERVRTRTPRTGGHARSPPAASKAAPAVAAWPARTVPKESPLLGFHVSI